MEKALKIEEYREIREKKERASQDLEGSPKALKEKMGEDKGFCLLRIKRVA